MAEAEFYDTAGTKLGGTVFGSSPAYNNGADTFNKVSDGDTSTFFDYSSRHFGFSGGWQVTRSVAKAPTHSVDIRDRRKDQPCLFNPSTDLKQRRGTELDR